MCACITYVSTYLSDYFINNFEIIEGSMSQGFDVFITEV